MSRDILGALFLEGTTEADDVSTFTIRPINMAAQKGIIAGRVQNIIQFSGTLKEKYIRLTNEGRQRYYCFKGYEGLCGCRAIKQDTIWVQVDVRCKQEADSIINPFTARCDRATSNVQSKSFLSNNRATPEVSNSCTAGACNQLQTALEDTANIIFTGKNVQCVTSESGDEFECGCSFEYNVKVPMK